MAIDSTKIAKVKTAMDNRYENKQANKKTTISGSYTGDNDSYPTVLACLNKFGELITSWSTEASDSKYPSEKLVKTELDKKINKSNTVGLVKNDGTIDTSTYLTQHQSLSNYVQKSQTSGLIKNDGTIDSSAYITSASLPTKTSDLTNDGEDGTNGFVSNNDSRLSDARTPTSHTHGNLTNDGKVGSSSGKIITTGTSGILQASDSITKSMISDFPTTMAPTSHTHGDITNDGKIGTNGNLPLITGSGGKIEVGSFGTAANTFCEGNDSRLSDSRTPTSHTHGSITNDGKIGTASGKIITTGTSGVLQASDSITVSMISDFPSDLSPTAHTHGAGDITDANAHSNLNTSANATQADINTAVDTLIGSLLAVDLVEVTTDKGTASANTMNKLYLVAESTSTTNDAYEIFVTVRTGTSGNYSYAWEKIDTARIDLSGYINTAGTGLSKSGNTLNHSNSITAVTTAAFKKFKYDAQGHITGVANVDASDLPNHTHNYATIDNVDSEINQALDDLAELIYPTSS